MEMEEKGEKCVKGMRKRGEREAKEEERKRR